MEELIIEKLDELAAAVNELTTYLKQAEIRRHFKEVAAGNVCQSKGEYLRHVDRRYRSIHKRAVEIGAKNIVQAIENDPAWNVL